MLPDLRGAQAIQQERVRSAEWVNRDRPANPGRHSLIELIDYQLVARFHAFRERHPINWHWPTPLHH